LILFIIAVEDSELNSDRTLDDDNEEGELPAEASLRTSQRSKRDSANCRDGQSLPAADLEPGQSPADDTADSQLKDDDWTYPDDNSPGDGSRQPRERRDSGVGSSLTRSSK